MDNTGKSRRGLNNNKRTRPFYGETKMPVVELNVKEEYRVESIGDFVRKFNLFKEFKETFGCDIEDWNYPMSDIEAIDILLKKAFPKKWWFIEYHDEGDGYFIIYELNENEPILTEQ